MILGDETYNGIIDQILQHDLTGYDVYLVGSILHGEANDLDVVVIGHWDYDRLEAIFEPLKAVAKLDLYWQSEYPFEWGQSVIPTFQMYRKWIGLDASPLKKSKGQLVGGFLQSKMKFPTVKSKIRKYEVKEPIQLIQNGEQIYF